MTVVEAVLSYVQVGRRRKVHRRIVVEGVAQTGTERCNIDDARVSPTPISDLEYQTAAAEGRLCGHCVNLHV